MGFFSDVLKSGLSLGGKALGGALVPFGGIGGNLGGFAGDQIGKLIPGFKKGGVVVMPNGQMVMVVKKKKSTKKRKGKK